MNEREWDDRDMKPRLLVTTISVAMVLVCRGRQKVEGS
jgi:hypothetical protein